MVTDSVDDLEVLEICAQPLRTVWPRARYRRALSRVYLPGEYITQIKRPGERYIYRGILQEDFAFWLLSSIRRGGPHRDAPRRRAVAVTVVLGDLRARVCR